MRAVRKCSAKGGQTRYEAGENILLCIPRLFDLPFSVCRACARSLAAQCLPSPCLCRPRFEDGLGFTVKTMLCIGSSGGDRSNRNRGPRGRPGTLFPCYARARHPRNGGDSRPRLSEAYVATGARKNRFDKDMIRFDFVVVERWHYLSLNKFFAGLGGPVTVLTF